MADDPTINLDFSLKTIYSDVSLNDLDLLVKRNSYLLRLSVTAVVFLLRKR